MTERTWALLIICITLVLLASVIADAYKASKKNSKSDPPEPKHHLLENKGQIYRAGDK